MDIVDQAQESEAFRLACAMSRMNRTQHELPANGRCHNCQAHVAPELRFCDGDCRDDYARRKDAELRRGRGPILGAPR